MPTHSQPNFVAGEVTPKVFGRTDLRKYYSGLAKLENAIIQTHGPSIRRSGTRFVAETKASEEDKDEIAILIPFRFNVEQTYILEVGKQYMRFYRNSARLEQAPGSPTEITLPYAVSDLRALKWVQSADILYVCNPLFEMRELRRNPGDDSLASTWSFVQFDSQDGPYLDVNTDTDKNLRAAAITGSNIDLFAEDALGNPISLFVPTDAPSTHSGGRVVRFAAQGAQASSMSTNVPRWGWARIVSFVSTSNVKVDIKANFANTTRNSVWQLGVWSDGEGWPWTVTIHQERLWPGGSDSHPNRLYGSVLGIFNLFSPTASLNEVDDTHSIARAVSADEVQAIRWLFSEARGLAILTDGGEWIGSAARTFEPITPSDFTLRRQGNFGSHEFVQPHLVGNVILFLENAGREIREFVFEFAADRFVARDLTILSEHMTFGRILDSAYQKHPNSILWLARCDGTLVGMTYERLEEVVAWHRQIIGGSLTGASQPKVESIAVIREKDKDQLWMIVKRTINGKTKRYVEFMEPEFDNGS